MSTPAALYYPEIAHRLAERLNSLRGQKLAVLGHIRPDGDCIGSTVGLVRALRAQGYDAVGVNHHPVPTNLQAFLGDTPFYTEKTLPDIGERVAIAVDCAAMKRLGEPLIAACPRIAINLDHHISNENYGELNLIDGKAAATAEILAALALDLGWEIDAVAAQALYVGIATDTGQFRFSSTTHRTFELTCALMARGANPAAAANEIYSNESKAKLALLQRFLASFRYLSGGLACIGLIRDEDWTATGANIDDTEGLVDFARSIDGVRIGVLIEQRGGKIKGSFRAKDGKERVDLLAKQFNGGGHAAAAGFNPAGTLDEVLANIEAALEKHFAENP